MHFVIKFPSESEKKLPIMDVFMVTASTWSLNVTVEKEKAGWLLTDSGCRNSYSHQRCPRSSA